MSRNLTEPKERGMGIVLELNLIRIGWDLQVVLVRRWDLYLLIAALIKS